MSTEERQCYAIQPKSMEKHARLALAYQVYSQAHINIFGGTSFKDFYKTVFVPNTVCTKVMIYLYQQKIIGYASFQVYKVEQDKTNAYIVMSEMGMKMPHQHPTHFIMNETIKYWLNNPIKNIFILDTLLSPYIYKRCCAMAHQIYPKHNQTIPINLMATVIAVANNFGWNINVSNDVVIRCLKWKVERKFLEDHHRTETVDRNLEFYNKLVPDCETGKGLVVVIPVTMTNAVMSIAKVMLEMLRHIAKRHSHSIVVPKQHIVKPAA